MSLASLRFFAVCAAVLGLAPAAALAENGAGDGSSLQFEALAPGTEPRHVPLGLPTLRSGAGIARPAHMAGLHFWAAGTGYAVGRRSAGYRLGAGAALPMGETLALTAGYRVTGFSSGTDLDGETFAVDGQVAGAYFGFDLEF